MKPNKSTAVATWMLEHLTFGSGNEALSGDLLEELHLGRSATWYWRQVCSAIAAGVWSRLRDYALPLVFCAGWISLYPGWRYLSNAELAHRMPQDWTALSWPWSALLPLGHGLVPALTFVWLGFLVYVLARPKILNEVSAPSLLWGLSTSLNVLLVSTMLLLRHFRQSRVDLRSLMREDFYSAFHLLWLSVPLALSLLAALSSTVARAPRLMRRQRLSRMRFMGRVQRSVQSDPIG